MTENLVLVLAGQEIPLRAQESKSGNTYWAVLRKKADGSRYFSSFGQPIEALAATLPTQAVIVNGKQRVTVDLVQKVSQGGFPQRKFIGVLEVPGVGRKKVEVAVSDIGEGRWNLKGSVSGVSGAGAKKAVAVCDL